MQSLSWKRYLAFGVATICVFTLTPVGLAQDVVYLIVGISGVAAIGVGIRMHAPDRRLSWLLMMLGQLLWVLGDTVSSWNQDVSHSDSYPSLADVFYLGAYPLLAAGLVLLIRGRVPGRDVAGWLDSATLTAGLGVLSWVLLAGPTLEASQYSTTAAAVGIAYPAADILLVGLLIRLVTTPGGRTPSFRLLLSAIVLLVGADTSYTALGLISTANLNDLNPLWLASYVAWGAAALHPSMSSLSEPHGGAVTFTRRRLAAMTVASLVAPGTLAAQRLTGSDLDVWAVVVGSVVLFLLVVIRMNVVIRQIGRSNVERERLQRSLAYQATHDALTGLPNRAQALREIEAALSRAQRTGALLGLLFVDLDGFKAVNDSFGHHAGDEVLRAVAARLDVAIRGGDMVARLGGDEFVVLLESIEAEADALQVATRLIESVAEPITIANSRQTRVGASIGMAISQDGSTDAQHLLHEADTAVYRAKAAGRGRVEVFDNALRLELTEHAELNAALVTAVIEDQLVAHYQPIIDLSDDSISGYEALVRWNRPGHGLVQPGDFIPLAETSDLVCDVDAWVLDHATAQVAAWTRAGAPVRSIAVNISGRHISQPRIVPEVRSALERSGLDPRQLVLEITETVLIEDLLAIHHLRALQQLGVVVSIDDFGTGYNSISRLQHLPIDVIKIDRTFLDDTHSASTPLLQMMIDAAHAFGLPVVAEGVERPEQLALLRKLNCDSAQGFLLSRPRTVDQIAAAGHTLDQVSPARPRSHLPENAAPRLGVQASLT